MRLLLVLVVAAALAAGCGRSPAPAPPPAPSTAVPAPAAPAGGGSWCRAGYDEPDTLSPSYRPGAPVRDVVGTGHVLTGTVRSARDCSPIAGARVELWPEIAGKGHPDDQRATRPSTSTCWSRPPGSSRWPATATTPRAGPPAASTWCWQRRDRDGWRVTAALG